MDTNEKLMSVPEARNALTMLAWMLRNGFDPKKVATDLDTIAASLYRKPANRQAPVQSRKMTQETANAIRELAAAFPDLSQAKIASMVNVNPGRVSEVLAGKR